jgi:MFS transporter, SP family, general alpha glucoside:H+ symporter
MTLGMAGLGFVGTAICPFVLPYVGRRKLWLCGLTYCVCSLWIVAIMCFTPNYSEHQGVIWGQASILVVMQFAFALTVGPLGYIVSTETPSTKLRAKTLSITATINGFSYLILTILGPVLLNPGAANAGAKIQFLFGGIALIALVWGFFRLPETAGRTYEELDYLFSQKVPVRKFKGYQVPTNSQ